MLLFLALGLLLPCLALPLVVHTDTGALLGVESGDSVFLGIPFASPPVGQLRWKEPQPVQPWRGVRNANQFAPDCAPWVEDGELDIGLNNTSEDCLYLNVFAPPAANSSQSLPVAIWFYGGSWATGGTSFPVYNGSQVLLRRPEMIIVTVNYRLGALGFLSSSVYNIAGNFGLLDQRAAMQWVQRNIAKFGGDPTRVTIWGESAGAGSVACHLLMRRSWPLFRAAIMESGPIAGWTAKPQFVYDVMTEHFMDQLACSNLQCLRNKTAKQIQSVLGLPAVIKASTNVSAFWIEWGPVIDGRELAAHPIVLAQQGQVKSPVNLLLGTNTNEGTLLDGFPANGTAADYSALVLNLLGPVIGPKALLRYLLSQYTSPFWAFDALYTDADMACPARFTARTFSDLSDKNRVYLYQFNHEWNELLLVSKTLGVSHGSELPFVWNMQTGILAFPNGQKVPVFFLPSEAALRGRMVDYWANFIINGSPGNGWPVYNTTADMSLSLDLVDSTVTGLKKANCDWWGTINLLTDPGGVST